MLIARQFTNTRAKPQGLGRVGRYDEKCGRFKLDTLGEVVNKAEEEALAGKLADKISRTKKQQASSKTVPAVQSEEQKGAFNKPKQQDK